MKRLNSMSLLSASTTKCIPKYLDKTNFANNAVITKHMLLTEVFPLDSSTYLFVPR